MTPVFRYGPAATPQERARIMGLASAAARRKRIAEQGERVTESERVYKRLRRNRCPFGWCDIPLSEHPRCGGSGWYIAEGCGLLAGPGHPAEPLAGGLCSSCRRVRTEVAPAPMRVVLGGSEPLSRQAAPR